MKAILFIILAGSFAHATKPQVNPQVPDAIQDAILDACGPLDSFEAETSCSFEVEYAKPSDLSTDKKLGAGMESLARTTSVNLSITILECKANEILDPEAGDAYLKTVCHGELNSGLGSVPTVLFSYNDGVMTRFPYEIRENVEGLPVLVLRAKKEGFGSVVNDDHSIVCSEKGSELIVSDNSPRGAAFQVTFSRVSQ